MERENDIERMSEALLFGHIHELKRITHILGVSGVRMIHLF